MRGMTLRMYWDIPKESARAEVVGGGDMNGASGVSGKLRFFQRRELVYLPKA